jgi:hypothetical protein
VDKNLQSQPKQFWKYVISFKKINSNYLIKRNDVADEFAKHFQSVYNSSYLIVFPALLPSSEDLSLALVSDSDVIKAIERTRPSKAAGVDDIPAFIIKGCTDIFVPILKHIFKLSLSQQHFPTLWKQAAIVPVLKKGNCTSVSNYRLISHLSNVPKYLNLLFVTVFRII